MSVKAPAPTPWPEFAAWVEKADDQLLTPYTFALCYNAPEGEDTLAQRLSLVREKAPAAGWKDDAFVLWYDGFHPRYMANPVGFVTEAVESYERGRVPELMALSGVRTEAVPWLIEGALARGELTLLGADGGTGKGLVQAAIAASVTTGAGCPFLGGAAPEKAGNVLIFPGEDDPARVLRPRLLAAGADLSRVHVMTPELFYSRKQTALTLNSEEFRRYIAAEKPALVILDPLQSFLPASVDMARRNEMRATLTPLRAACAEAGAAGLIAMHTNKKAGVAGRQRLADSSDLWDMARVVFMMGKDPQQKGVVYLSNEKNNYAKPLKTSLISITDTVADGVKTAEALLVGLTDKRDADFAQQKARRVSMRQAVQDAIMDELSSSKASGVRAEALRQKVMDSTGCSVHTYKNVRAELASGGMISKQQIRRKDGTNQWLVRLEAAPPHRPEPIPSTGVM